MEDIIHDIDGVEQTSSDAFLSGWDDADGIAEQADQSESGAPGQELSVEPDSEHAEDVDPEADPAMEPTGEPDEPVQQMNGPEPPKVWDLQHLGERRSVNEAEMVALAQQGLDYQRIRDKYDEAKPVMELFGAFAREAGMSIQDYTDYIRMQAKQASGMSEDEARRTVDLEDREAIVSEQERQMDAWELEQSNRNAEEQRRANDIADFSRHFKDAAASPETIPPEVWEGVRQGDSLSLAYAMHSLTGANERISQLEQQLHAVQQNQKNEERSTGSMNSAGAAERRSNDPFLADWD